MNTKKKNTRTVQAKTVTIVLLTSLLALLLLFTAACQSTPANSGNANNENANNETQNETATQITFTLEVIDGAGNVSNHEVTTSETTLGSALIEAGLIEGDVSDFGLMVTHVTGIRADFVEDSAWWAVYISGEMAMAGVDDITIEEGTTYAFIYTPA